MTFKIALIGRPNVGKSTLFNRMTKSNKAIVYDQPGVTRDRKYAKAYIGPLEFDLIDTPGLEEAPAGKIEYNMMQQTEAAINEADIIFMLVDGKVGIVAEDKYFAKWLRKKAKQTYLLVNKCEKAFDHDKQYYQMGFDTPIPVSAEHGDGISMLYDIIEPLINQNTLEPDADDMMRIAIAGRPNSGKSTFINALLGESRLLAGPEAGVTRDSIEIAWQYKEQALKIIDTAGMRRRSHVKKKLEKLSVSDTLQAIRFANMVVLMLDASCTFDCS